MSSKFLYSTTPIDLGVLQDGTFKLNVESAQLSDLTPNLPVKTDINKKLVSGLIQPSDINGSIIGNPLTSNLNIANFDVGSGSSGISLIGMNTTIQNISSIDPNFTTITGDLTISNQLKTPLISDELLTSSIALTTGGINLTSDALNFNSHSVLSATGTGTQYFMGDGSLLQYSANSGNSNFYLYKSKTGLSPNPLAGNITYNNNNQSLATFIYINHLTRDGIDIEVFFKQISTLSDVYIQDQMFSYNWIQYNITGTPTIVSGDKITIPVSLRTGGGQGLVNFPDYTDVLLSFFTNSIEADTRISALEGKTQYQTGLSGTGITGFNGDLLVSGETMSGTFRKNGGLTTEFLKANGDVDSNTYALNSGLITANTNISTLQTKTQNMGAGVNQTDINGNLTVFGANGVIAQKFIVVGGVGGEFLKANGTLDSIAYSYRKFSKIGVYAIIPLSTANTNLIPTINGSVAFDAGEAKAGDAYTLTIRGTYTVTNNTNIMRITVSGFNNQFSIGGTLPFPSNVSGSFYFTMTVNYTFLTNTSETQIIELLAGGASNTTTTTFNSGYAAGANNCNLLAASTFTITAASATATGNSIGIYCAYLTKN